MGMQGRHVQAPGGLCPAGEQHRVRGAAGMRACSCKREPARRHRHPASNSPARVQVAEHSGARGLLRGAGVAPRGAVPAMWGASCVAAARSCCGLQGGGGVQRLAVHHCSLPGRRWLLLMPCLLPSKLLAGRRRQMQALQRCARASCALCAAAAAAKRPRVRPGGCQTAARPQCARGLAAGDAAAHLPVVIPPAAPGPVQCAAILATHCAAATALGTLWLRLKAPLRWYRRRRCRYQCGTTTAARFQCVQPHPACSGWLRDRCQCTAEATSSQHCPVPPVRANAFMHSVARVRSVAVHAHQSPPDLCAAPV